MSELSIDKENELREQEQKDLYPNFWQEQSLLQLLKDRGYDTRNYGPKMTIKQKNRFLALIFNKKDEELNDMCLQFHIKKYEI